MSKLLANLDNLGSNITKSHDNKELVKRYLVISTTLTCYIDARLYVSRSVNASVVYCDLWIHGSGKYGSANGTARGHGYDKQQAAVEDAIRNAGITWQDTSKGSYKSVETMLLAIAAQLTTDTCNVF